MTGARRPHLLGIDDGPFRIHVDRETPIVGVMMEGAVRVENVVITRFPVDGPDVTAFLANWIRSMTFHPALQGIVLGGITIAGLGVVDVTLLAERTGIPVLAVSRHDPRAHRLGDALRTARLEDRLSIVERTPPASRLGGVWMAAAGAGVEEARALVEAGRGKAEVPEALRVAHLIARALVTGASRGRA